MRIGLMFTSLVLISSMFAGCLGVGDEIVNPNDEPTPVEYTFTGNDANTTVSASSNDTLVELTMTQGEDLNWAMLSVHIMVNASAQIDCTDIPNDNGCFWTSIENDANQYWEISESISISEDSTNLCDTGGCMIEVELRKNTPDGVTTVIAEGIQISAE